MLNLPKIKYAVGKTDLEMVPLGGINYSDRISPGDLTDGRNISARRYPYLSTRNAREAVYGYENVSALAAWNELFSVQGGKLYRGDTEVGELTDGKKQFAVINTKLAIFPDKKYLDLNDNKLKPLGAKAVGGVGRTFTENSLTVRYMEIDGVTVGGSLTDVQVDVGEFAAAVTGVKVIENHKFGQPASQKYIFKYVEKAANTYRWQVYRPIASGNTAADTFYLTESTFKSAFGISYAGAAKVGDGITITAHPIDFEEIFAVGDVVTIEGSYEGQNDRPVKIAGFKNVTVSEAHDPILESTLYVADGTFVAEPEELTTEYKTMTISREVPDMDYICESNNRLWGCSNDKQTIYASALGDPTNFNDFTGISTDSYQVAVGSRGEFTGCACLGSSVVFFKEDTIHKVLGSFPAEYAAYTYNTDGVARGSDKSITAIGNTLYYVGLHGVYAYTGNTPQLISRNFGNRRFINGVGGTDGNSYYLCAEENGEKHLFVYELQNNMWIPEDNTDVTDFARLGKDLYFVSGGRVYLADAGVQDASMEWSATFAPLYETITGRKKYTKLVLRVQVPKGAHMVIAVKEGAGAWREVGRVVGHTEDAVRIPIPIGRCDKLQLRLSGKGPCAVLSVAREFSMGSDI